MQRGSDMRYYDTVVICGGPAGMAAALSAYEAGAKTLIIETNDRLGGILNQCIHNGFGLHYFGEELTGPEYADRFKKRIAETDIDVMTDTLVTDIGEGLVVNAMNSTLGAIQVKAGSVVYSLGCRERPRGAISISGTRPAGIFTAGTAQYFVNIEGKLPGRKCVILGSGDIGLIMARRMLYEGAEVSCVVELMPYSSGLARNIKQCLNDNNIPLLLSHTVVEIHGKDRLEGVTIAQVDEKLRPIRGTEQYIDCDCLLLSVGLIPQVEMAQDCGAMLKNGRIFVDDNYMTSVRGLFACGNTLHVHDLVDNVTEESIAAGRSAAEFALGITDGTSGDVINVQPGNCVTYVIPNILHKEKEGSAVLRFRVSDSYRNREIRIRSNDTVLYRKKAARVAPGEMQSVTFPRKLLSGEDVTDITVEIS